MRTMSMYGFVVGSMTQIRTRDLSHEWLAVLTTKLNRWTWYRQRCSTDQCIRHKCLFHEKMKMYKSYHRSVADYTGAVVESVRPSTTLVYQLLLEPLEQAPQMNVGKQQTGLESLHGHHPRRRHGPQNC